MKRLLSFAINTVAPVLVIGLAIIGFRALVAGREEPQRRPSSDSGMLVDVETARVTRAPVVVSGEGNVVASRTVTLQPQVTGRLTWVAPSLVPGGYVDEGDVLARIEDTDFAIGVSLADASLEQTRAQLEIERGRQRVAQREWELYGEGEDEMGLATRAPQLRTAEIAVELAEAQLRKARVDAARAVIRAPFSGVVTRESADVGQLVSPQAALATLVGTDVFRVEISVPVESLAHISIPGVNGEVGSEARVTYPGPSGDVVRRGRVERLLPELSAVGRMARVIVEVHDPFDRSVPPEEREPPLLLSSFVRVELEGATTADVVAIPRAAVHDGDRVYVAEDGVLRIRRISAAWRDDAHLYVTDGVGDGEHYIVSPISIAVDGMRVRTGGAAEGSGD
jgi:RND family efflux transporter MFP subunit